MSTDPVPVVLSGREPRLSETYAGRGRQRLSLRNLATMLNVLPPDAISLEAAAEALRSKDFYVRFSAAELLARRGDRDARLIMQDVLATGDAPLRASVARHLHRFTWFVAEPLIRQALRDPDPRVHEAVVYSLCNLSELNGFQLLAEILPHENDDVRMAAAWGLAKCRDAAAVPLLEIVLQAADPEVRVKAVEALGANDTPEAVPAVRRAVGDPDPEVRYAATLSLIELTGDACLPDLAAMLRAPDSVTRRAVLRGLFHATNYLRIDIGRSPAAGAVIEGLECALSDPQPDVRLAAVWPLAWMRHPDAERVLLAGYARETDVDVKAAAVRIAAGLMSPAGEVMLDDARRSADERLQAAAADVERDRAQGAAADTGVTLV